jgi:heme/copper-type cytochrome/quinol oxidase subunit 2
MPRKAQKERSLRRSGWLLRTAAAALWIWSLGGPALGQTRVIEILADHDSRYRIQGQKHPHITVKAGEVVTLRVTAKKARSQNRDGSIHGFNLLRAKDRAPVEGWDLLLKPGVQDFTLTAPAEPGEYIVVCTVICSQDHEQMNMKFVVLPQ